MSVYRDIWAAISPHQDRIKVDDVGVEVRLMKLSEEVGEAMQAYIGVMGANKRKGRSHTDADVAKELADVVITAMVALHDWTDSPEEFMEDHLQRLLERIKEEGS